MLPNLPNPLPTPLPAQGFPINPPIDLTQLSVHGKKIAQSQQPLGTNLIIKQIQFDNVTPTNASNQYLISLTIQASKRVGVGGAIGSNTESKTFLVPVTLDSAQQKIVECSRPSITSFWQPSITSANDITNSNAGSVNLKGSLTVTKTVSAHNFRGRFEGADVKSDLKNATIPVANVTGLENYKFSLSNVSGQISAPPIPDPLIRHTVIVDGPINRPNGMSTLTGYSPSSSPWITPAVTGHFSRPAINHPSVPGDLSCPNGTMAYGIHVALDHDLSHAGSPYLMYMRMKCR